MRNHPQTNGTIERLNRTVKDQLTLNEHASPAAFDRALEAFLQWYRYEHYHEAIGNLQTASTVLKQRNRLREQTSKARKKASLKPTKNPRKNQLLRAGTRH